MSHDPLRRNSIGVAHIVFFVMAFAAPLTAVFGVSPAAFAYGNGAGVPAVYLLVSALYLVFSFGLTAMSTQVNTASGFYAYVLQGLGRPAGVAVMFIAIASYQALALSCYALFGVFAGQMLFDATGIDCPWWMLPIPLALVVQACGRRALSFSGNLLALCLIGEVFILAALCVAIVMRHGVIPFPADSVATVVGPGFGVALIFVVTSFVGFEATVIFGEEARNPKRTIPLATIIAIVLIGLFYCLCTWAITIYYGPHKIASAAAASPGQLYLDAIRDLLGPGVVLATDALLITSVFACSLSLHSTQARYLASAAREGLCDGRLANIHPEHGSPHIAGLVQTAGCIVGILAFAVLRVPPYAGAFAWSGTFSSIGVLAVQIITSAAVIGFYRKGVPDASIGRWVIAPVISAAGLLVSLLLVVWNLNLAVGSESPWVFGLPVAICALGIAGYGCAVRMKRKHPAAYAKLGAISEREAGRSLSQVEERHAFPVRQQAAPPSPVSDLQQQSEMWAG